MVASLALVATLASVQISSAASGPNPPGNTLSFCQVSNITNPLVGSTLNEVVTMQGYARYGSHDCTSNFSESQLIWCENGIKVGIGTSKSHDFSP